MKDIKTEILLGEWNLMKELKIKEQKLELYKQEGNFQEEEQIKIQIQGLKNDLNMMKNMVVG